ncbi:MAG: type II toxin-antitoxin system HicB family antitoxin [Acidobacteria bacterium]|nr:type II toxin-antitoxin system HicB family antitoxin [Acidobacteriota bacterium]
MYRITLEIQRLPEGPYLGTSPDLPGLIVQASTPEEVVALAPAIAKDLITVMRETGQPLPEGLPPLEQTLRVTLLVSA